MSAQNSKRSATPASWKPGQSGNPGGRPKRTPEEKAQEFELRKACEALTPKALKTIVDLMNHADKANVRLAAATFIIERRYGKAVEYGYKESRVGPLSNASTETLLEMLREIERRKQIEMSKQIEMPKQIEQQKPIEASQQEQSQGVHYFYEAKSIIR